MFCILSFYILWHKKCCRHENGFLIYLKRIFRLMYGKNMNWYFPVTWMENLFSYIFFWFISEWSSKLFTFFFSQRKYSIIWPLHKNVSYLNNLDGCCCCKYHTIIRLFNLSDCIAIYILLRLVVSQKYCQIWIDIVNQSFEWWFMIS